MIARARVEAAGDRLVGLRSQAPLALRATPDGVYIVGAAAGPVGGDETVIEIDVSGGASLTLRSVAASVVLPGPLPSTAQVHARVGAGSSLRWHPQPTVLARGCRHHIDARVEMEVGARLEWWDDLVLGRHGEPSGSVLSRLCIDLGGRPLFRHELALGPDHTASTGPTVLGDARAVGSVIVVEPTWEGAPPPARLIGDRAALLPLDGPGLQLLSIGRVASQADVDATRSAVHR